MLQIVTKKKKKKKNNNKMKIRLLNRIILKINNF